MREVTELDREIQLFESAEEEAIKVFRAGCVIGTAARFKAKGDITEKQYQVIHDKIANWFNTEIAAKKTGVYTYPLYGTVK